MPLSAATVATFSPERSLPSTCWRNVVGSAWPMSQLDRRRQRVGPVPREGGTGIAPEVADLAGADLADHFQVARVAEIALDQRHPTDHSQAAAEERWPVPWLTRIVVVAPVMRQPTVFRGRDQFEVVPLAVPALDQCRGAQHPARRVDRQGVWPVPRERRPGVPPEVVELSRRPHAAGDAADHFEVARGAEVALNHGDALDPVQFAAKHGGLAPGVTGVVVVAPQVRQSTPEHGADQLEVALLAEAALDQRRVAGQ